MSTEKESAPGSSREEPAVRQDFIRDMVAADTKSGRFDGRVWTRFPPEPNAYLHIGHAKALLLNWGIAREFGGGFNLRFDDTNPAKEEQEYVDQIKEDLKWLGADWEDREFYASDYFEELYEWAIELIKKGKAFVCDLSADEVAATRGTLTAARQKQPLPRPLSRGKPRPLRADARGRVRRRREDASREDRHGQPQYQHARPRDVPHPPHAPSSRGRQVVHLPDV